MIDVIFYLQSGMYSYKKYSIHFFENSALHGNIPIIYPKDVNDNNLIKEEEDG